MIKTSWISNQFPRTLGEISNIIWRAFCYQVILLFLFHCLLVWKVFCKRRLKDNGNYKRGLSVSWINAIIFCHLKFLLVSNLIIVSYEPYFFLSICTEAAECNLKYHWDCKNWGRNQRIRINKSIILNLFFLVILWKHFVHNSMRSNSWWILKIKFYHQS